MAAKAILKWDQCRHLLVDGFDFGDTSYAFEVAADVPIIEAKVLHGKAVQRDAGIKSYTGKIECYTPDSAAVPAEGKVGSKVKVCFPASTGQHGGEVIFGTAVDGSFSRQGMVGEYLKVAINLGFDGFAYRGKVLRNSIMNGSMVANPDTTTATGSWLAMGATASGKNLITTVHLKAFSGTSVSFIIESDDSGHGSAVTRATHTLSAAGASLIAVAGPITDTDYRVRLTGTFTSVSALVAVAIK